MPGDEAIKNTPHVISAIGYVEAHCNLIRPSFSQRQLLRMTGLRICDAPLAKDCEVQCHGRECPSRYNRGIEVDMARSHLEGLS